MSQIFSRRAGTWVKLMLLGALAFSIGLIAIWRMLTDDPHDRGEPVEQPVPFSHKHHVGDVGLDCRYCHAGVETRAVAELPPIATCMTCHSQLYTDQTMFAPLVRSWESGIALHWQRVNAIPQFAYFNHSIHIAKGVGCVTCHGRIDQMPLTYRKASLSMAWCLDCHRAPEKNLRPRAEVYSMTWKAPDDDGVLGHRLLLEYGIDKSRLSECSVCHR